MQSPFGKFKSWVKSFEFIIVFYHHGRESRIYQRWLTKGVNHCSFVAINRNEYQYLSPKQRLMVAKKIQTKMSNELFADIDMELPDINMSESKIMQEVKAVRTLM